MKAQHDIDSYVSDLRRRLHLPAEVLERIVTETEAHLQDRTAAHVANGRDRREAERLAVAEFGPAWRVALRFRLAYLDVWRVLAWTGAVLLIAHQLNWYLSWCPLWPRAISFLAAELPASLILGLVVMTLFRRRTIWGAGLVSIAFTVWYFYLEMWVTPAVPHTVRHIWSGWQSAFCVSYPGGPPASTLMNCLRDTDIFNVLIWAFAWTLMGVWAAGRIRETITDWRARRATA